jgi:hypothetical protein
MDYRLALPPDLGVNAKEFVDAWNKSSKCSKIAVAKVKATDTQTYGEPTSMVVFGTIATGVATAAVYDLIKTVVLNLFKEKNPDKEADVAKEIEILSETQEEGRSELLYVRIRK